MRGGRAGAAHAVVAEGEVVPGGVLRVEAAQGSGHLFGRAPGQVLATGQAEVAGYAPNVGVEWNHEVRGGHLLPNAEVDLVRPPHHPPEVEVEALGRPAAQGV